MTMLLSDALQEYLRVNTRIRSAATHEHYARAVSQFSAMLGRPATLDDLTDDNLSALLLSTIRDGKACVTANVRGKNLRALWNWCAKRKLVEVFPTFADVDEPEPMPEGWSEDELHQLFAGCARQTGWIGPHAAATWWLALHWWLLSTGERIEATMQLHRSMVNLEKRIAKVPAAIRKGGRKNQVYQLSDRCCELFREVFRTPSPTGLVFDHNWKSWRTLFSRYRRLVRDCGLPYVRGKSWPKKMRVTVLTMIEAGGGDACKFARHSDPRVTEHYFDQSALLESRGSQWPPEHLNPEAPPRNWRNLWGLVS